MSELIKEFIAEFNSSPVEFTSSGVLKEYICRKRLIYPGSFNPLHSQHVAIMLHAIKYFSKKYHPNTSCQPDILSPVFEISKSNCDKPDVEDTDLIERIKTITVINFDVIVTRTPKFSQKNKTFTSSRYILGLDTFLRMIDVKYHYDNYELMFRNLYKSNNDYLIYPRGVDTQEEWNSIIDNIGKRFMTKLDLWSRFVFVPFDSYTPSDMSSTELRSKVKS